MPGLAQGLLRDLKRHAAIMLVVNIADMADKGGCTVAISQNVAFT